ncbi:hypothetical protein A3Q56_00501 [Intoshia linei]|uniref:Septin-type G domain-containing protein n=1 Tax=Intoshia linei TaxID=1819745 RepID=A0A177BBZ1_9BILA|nr:hypothetical protein A3Q56_00501 [Intoshia linei]
MLNPKNIYIHNFDDDKSNITRMKSSDIVTLLKLHKIVNVIPVIARSDLLNVQELAQMKWNILKQINDNNIEIYTLGDEGGEEDESGEYLEELNKLNRLIPFAVVGATDCSEGSGSKLRGRKYPWGFINIEDKDHCNFSALRAILTTYIADLKEVTENYLYEVYRCSKLRQAINVSKRQSRFTVDNNLK